MPYMPMNFYPKNCAVSYKEKGMSPITFSADLDQYDVIYEAAIDVYNYYDKKHIGTIILTSNPDTRKDVEVIVYKQEEGINSNEFWNETVELESFSGYKTKVTIYQDQYGNGIDYNKGYIYYTNDIVFPLKDGVSFNFTYPNLNKSIPKYTRTNGYCNIDNKNYAYYYVDYTGTVKDLSTGSGDLPPIASHIMENQAFLPLLDVKKKYYWTLTILNADGVNSDTVQDQVYDTWVADGYILKESSGTGKHWFKISPNEKISPVSEDRKRYATRGLEDKYFKNQKIYNEKTGDSEFFYFQNGTGYYDKAGEALRLCWGDFKNEESNVSGDEATRYAVFDRVLDLTDHTGELILNSEHTVNTVKICNFKEDGTPIDPVRTNIGYSGVPVDKDSISLTIDIYDMPIVKIFSNCYYKIDANNRVYFYAGGVYTDEKLNLLSITEAPSSEIPTKEVEGFSGPVTIVQYTDLNNSIPLWSENEDIYNDDGVLVGVTKIGSQSVYLKSLSGHYLNLKRNAMTCYAKGDISPYFYNDYYQIRCNYITSTPNYFEVIEAPEIRIVKESMDSDIELSGPARSFTGEVDNIEIEWSYWELKKINLNEFGDILGEEIVLITEKDYSQDIRFEYYGFQPTSSTFYYKLTLYVKDRRGLVASSNPLSVRVRYNNSLGENNKALVKWNSEKEGIELDFSSFVGLNGKIGKLTAEGNTIYSSGVPNKDFAIQSLATENEEGQKSTTYLVMGEDVDSILFQGNKEDNNVLDYNLKDYNIVFGFQAEEMNYTGKVISLNDKLSISIGRDELSKDDSGEVSGGDYILVNYSSAEGIKTDKFYIYNKDFGEVLSSDGTPLELGYSSSIIRSNNIYDYSKLYYLDSETEYSFSENAVFSFYDLFNCKSEIIGLFRINNEFKGELYLQFKKSEFIINWRFVTNFAIGENAQILNKIELFKGLGYSFLWVGKQKEQEEFLKENLYLIDNISDFEFTWSGYNKPKEDNISISYDVVFYTKFYLSTTDEVTLTVSSADIASSMGSYSEIVIYRHCYSTNNTEEDTIPIKSIMVSKIYAPMRKIYDYSVDNQYWYSYRIIPLYYNDEGVLSSIGVISTDDRRIKPEYYNITLYGVTNNYNEDNTYYFNPYENPDGKWVFNLDTQGDDITFTSETSVSPGATHAKVNKSDVLYMQSSVTAKLGEIKDEVTYQRDNYLVLKKLKEFLQSSRLKMIRLKNGLCIPIDTQIKTSKNQSNLVGNPTDITFEWYQILNEDNFFLYEPYLSKKEEFINVN